MKRTFCLTASLALAACSSPAGPLPSGTYHYVSNEAGVAVDSIVTISRDATAIVVHEDARFVKLPNAPPVSIETRLDPKTFSTNAVTIANDAEMENPTIAIAQNGATVTPPGKPSVTIPPAAGAAPAAVDTNWASSYLTVPAMVRATGAKTLNLFHTALFHGRGLATRLTVVSGTAARPDGVPSGDTPMGLAMGNTKLPFVTLWYDPSTDVVSAVQLGLNNELAFLRK